MCGGLVSVLARGHNMHQASLCSSFVACQLGKADQLGAQERANEDAAIKIRRGLSVYRRDVLAIVVEAFSLAHGALVIDLPYSLYEKVIEGYFPNSYSFFLSLLRFVPGLEADLFRPPMLKG